MAQDTVWKEYLSNNARYADIINGIACGGRQLITKDNLQETDTQTSSIGSPKATSKFKADTARRGGKIRDTIRKAAFGVNFAIIGIENQETIDYSMPLRNMLYDASEYEKQAARIRKAVRKNSKGLSAGEYLYGFKKDSKLYPTVTFILYAGIKEWDGPNSLHEMLDFTDIPEELRELIQDYKIKLIEIRKLQDTSVFRTDVRQVFDFIRFSENKQELMKLVETDAYYKNMDEDAYNVVAHYANADKLIAIKDYHRKENGQMNMCTALREMIEDGREEGRIEGIEGAISICRALNLSDEIISSKIQETFNLSEEEAERYLQ